MFGKPIRAEAATVAAPEMVTRQGVPIVRTGSYLLSTGPATFTEEDLRAAVEAYANDPAVHAPRIKLDGLAESFNPEAHGGEPAVGTATNLRLSANGQEVLADLVIPKWLDDVADWAYPNRSIEGVQGAVMPGTGQKHDLVITSVALLGVDLPGVNTLPDLQELLANGPEHGEPVPAPAEVVAAEGWSGEPVRAGMDQDIVRRRFYEAIEADGFELPEGVDSFFDVWICAVRFDAQGAPYLKVVDEASGRLYRVDFSISGNDVTFANGPDWAEVVEEDVPVAAGAARPRTVAVWASRVASRPETPESGDDEMDVAQIREAAGLTAEQLPDDATPEQVATALRQPVEVPPAPSAEAGETPPAETAPPAETPPIAASAPPEGTVQMDAEEHARLLRAAETAERLEEGQRIARRDELIAAAMAEGRFGRARRDHYARMYDTDPEGTKHLLTASAEDGGLAPGAVPRQEVGATSEADSQGQQGTGLFPQLNQRLEA
jgi:hypothetical protein